MATDEGEKKRLFIAVPVPDQLVEFVRSAQAALPPAPGLRLLDPAQWHITLAFIGEVDRAKAEAAHAVVRSLSPDDGGEARITRFVMLPSPARARVVALEVEDTQNILGSLFERVMTGLEAAGVMRREKRPFRPHLTIARLRVPRPLQPRYESGEARFAVESVCLYKSELRREGAVHSVQCRTTFRVSDAAKA